MLGYIQYDHNRGKCGAERFSYWGTRVISFALMFSFWAYFNQCDCDYKEIWTKKKIHILTLGGQTNFFKSFYQNGDHDDWIHFCGSAKIMMNEFYFVARPLWLSSFFLLIQNKSVIALFQQTNIHQCTPYSAFCPLYQLQRNRFRRFILSSSHSESKQVVYVWI